MAFTPSDFENETLTPSDFELEQEQGVGLNKKSASQLAAGQTILTSADPKEYADTRDKLMNGDSQGSFLAKQEQINEAMVEDARESIPEIINDPNLGDDAKLIALKNAGSSTVNLTPSSNVLLAEEMIVADSGSQESERASEQRSAFLDQVIAVDNHKRQMQAAVNGLNIETSFLETTVDVGEIITPFAEWIHIDRLLKDVKGESSTGLLGQQRQELFDMFDAMTLDERAAASQWVIDTIKNNENVVLPDGNDLLLLDTLNKTILQGEYSNTERWVDNITSVLEIAGLTAPIAGAIRGVKTSKNIRKLSSLQEEADAFVSSKEPTVEGTFGPQRTKLTPEEARAKTDQEYAEIEAEGLAKEAEEFKANKKPEPTVEEVLGADKFTASKEPTADSVFRDAKSRAVKTEVQPLSPLEIAKDTNPELVRQLFKAIIDGDDDVAIGIAGASRTEAIAKMELPTTPTAKGRMENKPRMQQPEMSEAEHARDLRKKYGNTILSEKEITKIREKVQEGLEQIEGMVMHKNSMIMKLNPDESTTFTARYSPPDSGFDTPEQAVENAKVAFRNYGLTEDNFSILARRGDEWEEVNMADIKAEQALRDAGADLPELAPTEFAIGMKYTYRFKSTDLDLMPEALGQLTTAPGLAGLVQGLDRSESQFFASRGQGSIVQNVLDAASVIHPRIVNAASVAVDRSFGFKALYADLFENFAKGYKGLKKDRKALMTDYIHKANLEGIPLSESDLWARGFNEKEIGLLKQWRKANDTMWYAANSDFVKSAQARGTRVFTHSGTNTKLTGTIASKAEAARVDMVDPATNKVVQMDAKSVDEFYEAGGEVMKLDQPIRVDGLDVEYVRSANTPEAGYNRAVADDEMLLAYREGYYPVMYDANYFIYKKNKDGTEGRVIASAKNQNEVKHLLKNMAAAEKLTPDEADAKFGFRQDNRGQQDRNQLFDQGAWDMATNSGMSAQKYRGERLADAGSDLHNMGKANLLDPLEAVSQQINSISARMSMREYLNTAKKRWEIQYGDYLEFPKGMKPTNPGMIKGKPNAPSKMVADARTNFNYIYSLEKGFINTIDDQMKGALNQLGEFLGEKGFGKLEEAALSASKVSPAQAAKSTAFKLYLSANPVRQALVQRGQMIMLGAHNPEYVFKGEMIKDLGALDLARKAPHLVSKKYRDLADEVADAGIIEAVDAHTLLHNDLMTMAEKSWGAKALTPFTKTMEVSQKYGFTLAEQDVLLSAWLSARNKAAKKYSPAEMKTQRVKDEILGETRAWTLNMNRAGEQPYSQNTLALPMQFFSFQHKAFLQPLLNRNLPVKERAKLLAYTTLVFGMDATLISMAAGYVFGDEASPERDKFEAGLLDVTLNATLSALSEGQTNIDFGDFAPTEAYGMGDMLVNLFTTNPIELFTDSPAGSLLFGGNGRLTQAFNTGARYFNVIDDYEDPALDTKWTDVAIAFANVFSGASNSFKARYAFESGKMMASSGRITDDDVTKWEAAARIAGFQTRTESGMREIRDVIYGNSSFDGNDMDVWYAELKRHLARRYTTVKEERLEAAVLQEAWRVFGDDRPRVREYITRKIANDAKDKDFDLIMGLISKMGLNTREEMLEQINLVPDVEKRKKMIDLLNLTEEMRDGIK